MRIIIKKRVDTYMEEKLTGMRSAPQRALLKASGLSSEEMKRPRIGVIHTQNEASPCGELLEIIEAVKAGIRIAGGTPAAVPVPSICEAMALGDGAKYTLFARDLMADACETIASAYGFEALVFVSGCPNDAPGMVMAAIRLNLPAIFVSGGVMLSGCEKSLDEELNFDYPRISDAVVMRESHMLSARELLFVENNACPTRGACGNSTGHCFVEAMGLSLPRDATLPTVYSARIRLSKQAGMQIMYLLENQLLPRDIITEQAIENAVVTELAMGGSTDTMLHLLAIARTAGLPLSLNVINSLSAEVPILVSLSPMGRHSMWDLHTAGGIPALMKTLGFIRDISGDPVIHTDCVTVTGQELFRRLDNVTMQNSDVIRSADTGDTRYPPYEKHGGFHLLFGSLAPEGAVCCASHLPEILLRHTGPARVFESEDDAETAIETGKITYGDIIVIRGIGPKGGPGMPAIRKPLLALAAKNLDRSVVLITDGRFLGSVRCVAIAHVSPEAALDGPIALVEDGDDISVDVVSGIINLEVPVAELMRRLKTVIRTHQPPLPGALARYAEKIFPARDGAITPPA